MAYKGMVICDWCKKEKANPQYWIEVSYKAWVKQDCGAYHINNHFDFCSNECVKLYVKNVGLKDVYSSEHIMESE